ncbi:MAG: hypothetical protein RR357_03580 [Clostridia bacterium]
MELKNSVSILMSKFSINYRVMLFVFISLSVMLGFGVSVIIPSINRVFNSIEGIEVLASIKDSFVGFLNGDSTMRELLNGLSKGYNGIIGLINSSNFPFTFWVTIVSIFVLLRFATAVCYPIITDIINNFMSSNMKYGFTSSMVKNAKKSISFSACYTLVTIPIDAIIVAIIFGFMSIMLPMLNIFAFMFGLLLAIILLALRITLLSGILPTMIVEGENNFFKAFRTSWGSVKKYFKHYFAAMCLTIFVFYCFTVTFFFVTFGTILFVLSAVIINYIHVLELVHYYGSKNMRYYVDSNTIVNTAPIIDRIDLQEELLDNDEK